MLAGAIQGSVWERWHRIFKSIKMHRGKMDASVCKDLAGTRLPEQGGRQRDAQLFCGCPAACLGGFRFVLGWL